jgi:signal transduction histidine kinase
LYQRPLSWLEAVVPEDRARVERELREGAATGQYDSEFRITLPNGMTRWIWDRGFPVRDEQGRTYRIAGLKEDVTALKAAQARVLQSERLAAIGEAMTGLAHESRNALQRSQAGLEMLARRIGDRDDARELLAQTQDAQHHLHRLYEEVRDYAAPLRLHRQQIALSEVLEQAWEHLAGERAQRQAQLVQAKADSQCWGDPIALGQVFRNLLENSLHAARDPVEIKVAWDPRICNEQEGICVILEDNGPGLTAEQAAHIFDPFYTTKVRGTGLGMAICRRIVEEHGGQIAVEPSNGCGARISILLPRSQP